MRFAFYIRVSTVDQQDPEKVARCRALMESIIAKHVDTNAATYLDVDGSKSPYRRATNQPEPSREKAIP